MALLTFLPEIAAFMMLFMMATQVPQIGALLILAEFAFFGLLFIFRTMTFVEAVRKWWWLLLFPLIQALSGLWSDLPEISFRYGAQFFYTCFVGVVLACLISPRRYVQVLLVMLFFFCLACIAYGRQGTSATGMVLIGLTGSKNQMGYAGQLLSLAAVAVLLMRDQPKLLRGIAFAALPVSAFIVWGTNSATALLMAIGGAFVLAALWFSERLPPGGRLGTILMSVLIFSPLLLLLPEAIAFGNHFLFDTLGKDPTLTGRTFLWERADALIERRPILGYGFQAIWMGDSTDTIGLKRLADIEDGRQFHFHHQFRIVAVDSGIVGLTAFVGAMIAAGLATVRQLLLRPTVETSFFFVVFALMVTRAFTDQIMSPFNMHTLIYFACCVYAFWRPQEAAQPAVQGWRRGLARA